MQRGRVAPCSEAASFAAAPVGTSQGLRSCVEGHRLQTLVKGRQGDTDFPDWRGASDVSAEFDEGIPPTAFKDEDFWQSLTNRALSRESSDVTSCACSALEVVTEHSFQSLASSLCRAARVFAALRTQSACDTFFVPS